MEEEGAGYVVIKVKLYNVYFLKNFTYMNKVKPGVVVTSIVLSTVNSHQSESVPNIFTI